MIRQGNITFDSFVESYLTAVECLATYLNEFDFFDTQNFIPGTHILSEASNSFLIQIMQSLNKLSSLKLVNA